MTFINTDGMAFIGPGSEWFWTAISGVVLAITFVAIYRQLRLQRDAAAVEQLNGVLAEWSSERSARAKLAILLAFEAGADPAGLPNRAVAHVGFFLQKLGFLVRNGHMDRRLVCEQLGDQIQQWWARLGPGVVTVREADGDPTIFQHFEWLARAAAALDAKRGIVLRIDAEALAEQLPGSIEHFRQAIELEEMLRTLPVRLTETPIPVTGVRREPHARRRTQPA